MALLLAYVGGKYKGNTHNAHTPRGSTVDDVVEDAVFSWGGILLPNYRSRGLQRLKWSRSSRTDKGVSSLCTVVSLRAEIDPTAWDDDVEARAVGGWRRRRMTAGILKTETPTTRDVTTRARE